jgi:hypothetical protein
MDDMLLFGRHIGELARAPTANVVEVRYEGPWSGASYSWDEDHTKLPIKTVVFVSIRLHPTNFGALHHAFGSICYDTAFANLWLSRKDCPTPGPRETR